MLIGLSIVVIGILLIIGAVYVAKQPHRNKLTKGLYSIGFEFHGFVVGAIATLCGLAFILIQSGQQPTCQVTKQAYDIDQYEYVLSGSDIMEYRSKDKKDLKKFLDACSQIQRKQKWLEEHDEVETLMEVK